MPDKKQIIQIIEELAVLLDLKGANPFKIRAFTNASRILQNLNEDLGMMIETDQLSKIKGIGKGINDLVKEINASGESAELKQIKAEIPAGLPDLLRIPGVGAKKVKTLWKKLEVTSIGELEYACRENRLVDLEGFGEKSQRKILDGIQLLKKFSSMRLFPAAESIAMKLLDRISQHPDVIRCEIAGSLRRKKETVKDIDILVGAARESRADIMQMFVTLPEVDGINGHGETKSSVLLSSGIQVDLRIVSDAEFPFALHHFTGSREHNVAMRQHAKSLGLKMNEYGLYRDDDTSLKCGGEADIFKALNLAEIPPELREDMGEIGAAAKNLLPNLIRQTDIRGVVHNHSTWSDGANGIEEMALACMERGYQYLVMSDHSQTAVYARGLSVERIARQQQEIDALNEKYPEFRILKSIESDILPNGELDYDEEILKTFDLVIASIHSKFNMTPEEATNRIIRAMENPYTTIIGHPTGRLLLSREGYPVDMRKIIEKAAEFGVALELNSNPQRLDVDWRLLKTAKAAGVKIAINPDAHRISGIDDIRYGIGVARKGWLEKDDVLNCLDWREIIAFAKKRR